jgi:subtilisin family serine protease
MGPQLRAFIAVAAGLLTFATANAKQPKQVKEPEAVPGEYVVKLKKSLKVSTTNKTTLRQILNSEIKSILPQQNIVVVKRPTFELRANAVKTLSAIPSVKIAEPNFIYRINKTPNDPMLGQLWGLANTGIADSGGDIGVAGVDIGAEKAWDIQTGSKKVLVAVIDTGILYTHDDLKDNVWTNPGETGTDANGKDKATNGVDDDANGFIDDVHGYDFSNNDGDPLDDHGHGSHCSGTIGAKGDDGKGLVGVNWDVQIMGVKFLSGDGSGTLEGATQAIDYAVKMKANILSNSWGGGGYSQILEDSIKASNAAGALFVAAAGNESSNNDSTPSYPNSYDVPNVLSVAAINNRGQLSSFSNYGRKNVHVAAPGENIMSSTTTGYESWSGTSMATPHVTGIAALVLANEPNISNIELKNRIIATAQPLTGLKSKVKSGGLANAYAALTNTVAPPDPNDPSNWATTPVQVSTAHPYADKTNENYTVHVDGAHQIALYFEKFDTEGSYDVLTITDASGKVVDKVSGNNDDSFSVVIDGDTATLNFTADDSVNAYGFDITKAAYR